MKDEFRRRRDGVTIPTIWIAIALSVLLHIALMWKYLPQIRMPSPELDERGQSSGSLSVQLAPPRPPPVPAIQARPAPPPSPPPRPSPPKASRPVRPPPVLAMRTPPPSPAPTIPVPAPAAPVTPPPVGDFASNIEARRRARGESTPPPSAEIPMEAPPVAEDDRTRANRIAAANLATKKQTFGYDPSQGGGVFQIVRINYLDAEFLFFGWNKDIRRNTKQLIEVPKGNNADTRIAVVRKMIAIIREHEEGDFLWESQRLGRNLTLSARARDNASLEQFMMLEFFEDPQRPAPLR